MIDLFLLDDYFYTKIVEICAGGSRELEKWSGKCESERLRESSKGQPEKRWAFCP